MRTAPWPTRTAGWGSTATPDIGSCCTPRTNPSGSGTSAKRPRVETRAQRTGRQGARCSDRAPERGPPPSPMAAALLREARKPRSPRRSEAWSTRRKSSTPSRAARPERAPIPKRTWAARSAVTRTEGLPPAMVRPGP